MRFFFRNAPATVADAIELSEDQFLDKYKQTTATQDVLKTAYSEIRAKHVKQDPAPPATKHVTFKVVQTDDQVISIGKPVWEDDRSNPLTNAARGRDEEGTNSDEIRDTELFEEVEEIEEELTDEEAKELAMLEAANEVEMNRVANEADNNRYVEIPEPVSEPNDPVATESTKKTNRGRKRLENADKRDARILELLREGKKGSEIIKILKAEGLSVHAPQITAFKNKLVKET